MAGDWPVVRAAAVAAPGDFRCGSRAGKEGIGSLRSCRGRWCASRSSSAPFRIRQTPGTPRTWGPCSGSGQQLREDRLGCRDAQADGPPYRIRGIGHRTRATWSALSVS